MRSNDVIPANVSKFVDECAKQIGRHAEQEFQDDIRSMCDDGIKSPIEQLFIAAFETVLTVNNLNSSDSFCFNGCNHDFGTGIIFQHSIGKYRVDFLIQHITPYMIKDGKRMSAVIVECDGHDFHEKTESDRRYEKQRDRYFQRLGYKVIHFTGSEIVKDPFAAAAEAISIAIGEEVETLLDFLN